MAPALLVMAAGLGSRYGGLKQIDPVGPSGETLLDYSLFDARRAGFGKIVFVIRRDIEAAFRKVVGRRYDKPAPRSRTPSSSSRTCPRDSGSPRAARSRGGRGRRCSRASRPSPAPSPWSNATRWDGRESYEALHAFLAGGPPADLHALVAFRLDRTLRGHGPVARGLCDRAADGSLRGVHEVTAKSVTGGASSARATAPSAATSRCRSTSGDSALRSSTGCATGSGLRGGARRGGEPRALAAGRRRASHRGGDGARPLRPGDAEPVVRDDAPRGRESGRGVAPRARRGGGVSGSALGG